MNGAGDFKGYHPLLFPVPFMKFLRTQKLLLIDSYCRFGI